MPPEALLELAFARLRTLLMVAGWAGVAVLVLFAILVEWDRRHEK